MAIPTEQLLNIPAIRVLSVSHTENKIECEIESIQGHSIRHKCGRKADKFHEHEKQLELRHLPLCGRQVILRLRPKRYRCSSCDGVVTTREQPGWYDAKSGCTKAFAEFLLLELVNSTIQDVSRKHCVTYDLVRGALKRYVKGEVDWSQIKVQPIPGSEQVSGDGGDDRSSSPIPFKRLRMRRTAAPVACLRYS